MKCLRGPLAVMAAVVASRAGATVPTTFTAYDAQGVLAPFLSLGVSARAVGMGEAFTAVSDDASAVLLNPGGLGQVASFNAVAQFATAGDGMSHNVAALAAPLGPGVLGVGVNMMQLGSYDVVDALGVKSGTESPMDAAGSVGYGIKNPAFMNGGWSGVSVEAVKVSTGATVIAGNLGTVYPFGEGFAFGLALQHLGAKTDGFSLPSSVKGGFAYVLPGYFRAALDSGLGLTDKLAFVALGVEYAPIPTIAIRAGYKKPFADQGLKGINGVTAGAGFRINSLSIDYAFQPMGDVAVNHLVSLSYHPGPWVPQPTAEQVKAEEEKAASEILNVAVMDLAPQNVSAGDAGVISDILRSELVKVGTLNVLERQNMQKILAEHAFQQTGCTSEECAVKLGKLLNVQRMIAGSLGKLGDQYYVNARIVDIQTGKVVWSDSAEASSASSLAKKMPSLASRLGKKLK